jgi:L-aspartate oxidase
MDLKEDELKEVLCFTELQRKRLQHIMWDYVGIIRSTERLEVAQRKLSELEAEWKDHLVRNGWKPRMVNLEVCEMRNLISVANLVVSSALVRQESRGLHYTTDFPMLVESARLPTILFPSSSMNTWSSKLVHRMEVETR